VLLDTSAPLRSLLLAIAMIVAASHPTYSVNSSSVNSSRATAGDAGRLDHPPPTLRRSA